MTIAFDTMKFVDQLVAGGFTDAQAKGAAKAFSEAMSDSVVTRADLQAATDRLDARIDALEAKLEARIDALEARLDSRINALEAKFDSKFEALELRLTVRLGAMLVVAVGVVATVVKLLH